MILVSMRLRMRERCAYILNPKLKTIMSRRAYIPNPKLKTMTSRCANTLNPKPYKLNKERGVALNL